MTKTNEVLWKEYHEEGNKDSLVELVQKNRGIINVCAKNWQYSYGVKNIEMEDLCSVGLEAILVAAETYDPGRGALFITHATNVINSHMQRYMFANAGLIRMPEEKVRVINRIMKCKPEDEIPDLNEWYENFCEKYEPDISYEQFYILIQMDNDFGRYSSLNELLGEDQTEERLSLIGNSESPEELYLEESLKVEIEKCLEILDEREQEIIVAYFGLAGKEAKSLKEIAQDMHISTTRVGEIKNKALRKLKRSSKAKGLSEYL